MVKRHIKTKDELGPAGKRRLIGVLLIWVISIVCILVWVAGAGITSINNKRTLQRTGIAATGTVTRLDSTYNLNGRYGGWNSYWVTYAFVPHHKTEGDSGIIRHRDEVPADLYKTLKKGSSIEVTYREDNPKINAPTVSLRLLPSGAKTAIRAGCSLLVLVGLLVYVNKKCGRGRRHKSSVFTASLYLITGAIAGILGGAVIGNAIIIALQSLIF